MEFHVHSIISKIFFYYFHHIAFPAGIWCQNDVVLTSMRRDDVASTLIRRNFFVMCPLGCDIAQISVISHKERQLLLSAELLPLYVAVQYFISAVFLECPISRIQYPFIFSEHARISCQCP